MNKTRLKLVFALSIPLLLAGCRNFTVEGEPGDPGEPGLPGEKGDKGSDGKTPYEQYIELHPEYSGDEKQWYQDLANGKLADYEVGTNGLVFQLIDNEFDVIAYMGTDSDVVIPSYFLGKPVTTLGQRIFEFDVDPDAYPEFDRCVITSITLPSTLKTIKSFPFYSMEISDIVLPDGLEIIDPYAFQPQWWGEFNLESIEIPDSVKYIGTGAFEACGLKSVKLPSSLKAIEGRSFFGNHIESIEIPASVKSIGPNAFAGCPLENVSFNEGLEYIGKNAFNSASAENIVLPSTLDAIGEGAFGGSSVKAFHVPSSVDFISYEGLRTSNPSTTEIFCEAESQPENWNSNWCYHVGEEASPNIHWGQLN